LTPQVSVYETFFVFTDNMKNKLERF
jgi:hypothetical protein